jgi:hypothetical protein
MADGVVNDTNQLPKISSETLNSESTGCYDCIQLKLELVKVSTELNWMREIIFNVPYLFCNMTWCFQEETAVFQTLPPPDGQQKWNKKTLALRGMSSPWYNRPREDTIC